MNEQNLSYEKIQQILEERARILARPLEQKNNEESLEIVTFALEQEKYGVEIGLISEIIPLPAVTFLPGLPAFWLGLINFRGQLVPLIDLHAFLGLPSFPEVKTNNVKHDNHIETRMVIITAANGWLTGLLIDDILGLRGVQQTELHPSIHKKADRSNQNFIQGITTDMLPILDIKTLLADTRLVILQETI